MKEINKLSDKELEALAIKIEKERSGREAEKKKQAERKKNYKLKTLEKKYEFLPVEFHREVMELGKEDSELMKKLKEIETKCKVEKAPPKEEVYPCPECGEMMLRPGNFGDGWEPKYQIMCDNCDFIAPVDDRWGPTAAWDEFHEWLVKEGYLER